MSNIFNALLGVLNSEISSGRGTRMQLDSDESNAQLRRLTVRSYAQRKIERRNQEPFQLRYAAWGEKSNMVCTSTHAKFVNSREADPAEPNGMAMAIEFDGVPRASLTLVLPSEHELSADALFPQSMQELRISSGPAIGEITSFLINREYKSRRVVAGLFHLLYLYARQAKGLTGMVAVCKQRHIGVYEDLLSFKKISEKDGFCLVYISLDEMRQKIRKHGGKNDLQDPEAGIYNFFFPVTDEAGMLVRLLSHISSGTTPA